MGKKLSEILEEAGFYQNLKSYDTYRPYPDISDRSFWERINPQIKEQLLQAADKYLNFEWKNVTASSYIHYFTKGDRQENENQTFGKRMALGSLMLGECIKNDGTYLEAVINGIFSVCEETTWSVAAHIATCGSDGDLLPDCEEEILDLFAMETAHLMSFVYYLLKNSLDQVSIKIAKRIEKEINRRIITPYLKRQDYWWMGYAQRKLNNWTPWCSSNALIAAALVVQEEQTRRAVIEKCIESVEKFICEYPKDGACDEGTSYWFKAGGRVIVILDMLQGLTDQKLNFESADKINNMAAFIVNAHIGGVYYLNFADGSAVIRQPDAYMIYRMGELLKEESFKEEGIRLFDVMEDKIVNNSWYSSWNVMLSVMYYDILKDGKAQAYDEKDIWYRENQILITKYQGRSFAVKGGHNSESHNHNDVGNFVFYAGDKPVVIDAGVGIYTKDTFSEKRYEIWTMQSQYHNLPIINGIGQKNGEQYRAEQVTYLKQDDREVVSMHLKGAYPEEAKISSFIRTAAIGAECITVTDQICARADVPVEEVLMCVQKPQIQGNTIRIGEQAISVQAESIKDIQVDEIMLEDTKLQNTWGTVLYRIRILLNNESGCVQFTVSM